MSGTLQDQKLTTIDFKPGVVKEQSRSAADPYWIDADKVRFRFSKPELMGGWQNVTLPAKTSSLWGTPRLLETVRALDGTKAAVVFTNLGVWSTDLSDYNDITPIVTTVPGLVNRFSTSAGSPLVVASVSAHSLVVGTRVAFTSANTTIGGNILINADASTLTYYQVTSILGTDSFEFDAYTTAAATSAGTGGTFTVYQTYNAGTTSNVAVGGWGTGAWSGPFGWSTSPNGLAILPLRLWSSDLWGTEVVAVPNGGPLMLWQPQNGLTTRMVFVTAAPSVNQIVRVASEARHIVLYGTHDVSGTFDPLLIRWCSQENYNDWTPTNINTAGDYRLNSRGSEIIAVVKMADRRIVMTDNDVFSENYIGPPDIFGYTRIGEKCGTIGRNAAIEYGGVVYWLSSNGQFYKYDGRLAPLPCTVLRYVFEGINILQKDKIVAGTNSQFDEVIWFYPSLDSPDGENDRYVIYNTIEQHWTIGSLCRTAWHDRDTYPHPLAAGDSGEGLFYHEVGYTDDGSPLVAYCESAYFDTRDGDVIMFANKFSPDFSDIANNTPFQGSINVTLKARKYPGGTVYTKGPYRCGGAPQRISTRLRGREFAARFDYNSIDERPWRLGQFRMGLEEDGKR